MRSHNIYSPKYHYFF